MVQIPKGIHLSFSISRLCFTIFQDLGLLNLLPKCVELCNADVLAFGCCHAALSDVNGSGKVPFEFGRSGEDWRL